MAQITQISPLAPKSYPQMPQVAGVRIATGEVGFYGGRDDLLFVQMDEGTQVAGVYTRSLTASAPVEWCRTAQKSGNARALVVNAGNSNAFTGKKGWVVVDATVDKAAEIAGCARDEVFIASTGVIGEGFSPEKLTDKLTDLDKKDDWIAAAKAIMTTDTYPKYVTKSAKIGGTEVTINAIAKGSGMIAPNMATMLAFIFTDASLDADVMQAMLTRSNQKSFNSITVDSDTSTSDTALFFATGSAGNQRVDDLSDDALAEFKTVFDELMHELAMQIIKDGEGVTKLMEVRVSGAENEAAAHKIGMAIANSPLVKTAVAGEDPNWGRIVMAVGKSGEWADRDKLMIKIGDEIAAKDGELNPDYVEARAAEHMKGEYVILHADVGVGKSQATIWGCDLTNRYIEINADYRS